MDVDDCYVWISTRTISTREHSDGKVRGTRRCGIIDDDVVIVDEDDNDEDDENGSDDGCDCDGSRRDDVWRPSTKKLNGCPMMGGLNLNHLLDC